MRVAEKAGQVFANVARDYAAWLSERLGSDEGDQ
jgi:hypothetical protein